MDKLKLLNIKKLLNELNYLEQNYSYIQEIINEADNNFMKKVDETINEYPEIKEKYNKKVNDSIEKAINTAKNKSKNISSEKQEVDNIENKPKNKTSQESKKLYREIVKLTHPDKIKDTKLNELYIQATELYEKNDKIGLYIICNTLNIDVEIIDNDEILIKSKIKDLKDKINFIESTFTWKWYNEESEENKEKIVKHFINLKFK